MEGASRADVLGLLSVALRPPDEPDHLDRSLRELRAITGGLAGVGELVEDAVRSAATVPPEREYHRLFLGPARPVAPPFESVYADGAAFGPAAVGFLAELRDAGLELSVDFRLPPDHVAVQLEYLACLERRAEEASATGDAVAATAWRARSRAFADGHLARWLPPFLMRLEASAPGSPYTFLVRAAARAAGVVLPGEP